MAGALTQACPRAAAYRVLWAQAVVVVLLVAVPDAGSLLAQALAALKFEGIEHRALLVATSGVDGVGVLDGLLDALASRRNFAGVLAWPAVRLVDGVVER